jgi:transposase
MVCLAEWCDKLTETQFRTPPWTSESAEWKTLDEQLAVEHSGRRLVAAVDYLDLSELIASYSLGGSDALSPRMMLRMIVIEMWEGRTHPSQWFKDAATSDVLKWAGFGLRPSRSSWYNFRDRVGPFLQDLFGQTLKSATRCGMTTATCGALDGTFISADASRHHLLNSERLEQHLVELEKALVEDPTSADNGARPRWMASTPKTRQQQREKHVQARARLQEFHEINHRQPVKRRRPEKRVVVSVTDPEAAVGWDKSHVYRPLYDIQIMRDINSPLILAWEVFPQNNDCGTMRAMIELAQKKLHIPLSTLVCDANYITTNNLVTCFELNVTLCGPWANSDSTSQSPRSARSNSGIPKTAFTWDSEQQVYRCPEGHIMNPIGKERRTYFNGEQGERQRYRCSRVACRQCPRRLQCTPNSKLGRAISRNVHEDLIELHRARMATEEFQALYRRRKQTIELTFADLKQNRSWRTLAGRGLQRARAELGLLELSHNLYYLSKPRESESPDAISPEISVGFRC